MNEELFLKKKFAEFYSKNSVPFDFSIARREFGVGGFGSKIDKRHLSFDSLQELNQYLKNLTPFYISYSIAQYELPGKNSMQEKKLLGADLIYEFDADDLKTDCKNNHDSWKCSKCDARGTGAIPECTTCGSSTKIDQWVCQQCLNETKIQTRQLLSVLKSDFGIQEGIEINFSGHKGYHVHIKNKNFFELSKQARVELVDYLSLHDLSLPALGFYFDDSKKSFIFPGRQAKGLAKKIQQKLIDFIQSSQLGNFAALSGLTVNETKKLLSDKSSIINSIQNGSNGILSKIKAEKTWPSLLQNGVNGMKLNIDRQTSVDIHKLIRVPGTLHGGTGLQAKKMTLEEFEKSNPLQDCVVFSDQKTKVFVSHAPVFDLNGSHFGPCENEQVELPESAAIYLLAKGKAELR